jgi:hypothetical protein
VSAPFLDLAALDSRFYLSGDEDCGVGLGCGDCWDGGRPLAYYDRGGGSPYKDDAFVEDVTTISGLLAVATRHEREVHG